MAAPAQRTAYDPNVVAGRLTADRMGPYLDAAGGDPAVAMRLYDWNSAVAGDMHADLGRLEIVFRNAVDMALKMPALASAFPRHPARGDPRRIRADVERRMKGLHLLRNRIAHHEPIFRRDLARDHAQLLELIGWMCADSQTWAAAVSRTLQTIAERDRRASADS